MKIAVEGCCHGELDNIYQMVEVLEQKHNMKVDLLLICGDFQSVRNTADLECMAVPPKYRTMRTFYKYYTGEKVAPVLTVFVGGNHEASNYLQELPYGGWVAPKIYYMGYANVLQFGGVRIGGLSGIYKPKHYTKGHYEHPPYTEDTKRSAYHIRNVDVFRLKQLKEHVDLFLSHDWPLGIYKYGNVNKLLAKKKFLRDEINSNTLGSKPGAELLHLLQPSYWFSAHLHTKFAAMVKHSSSEDGKVTRFLSLDKCLPQRQFLQVLDIPHDSSKPLKLQLDPEWLAILKSTNHLLNLSRTPSYLGGERESYAPTKKEVNAVIQDFDGNLAIPDNFQQTVPAFDPNKSKKENQMPAPKIEINPQTTLLCSMLDLTDPNAVFLGKDSAYQLPSDANLSEIGNSDDDNDDVDDDDIDSEQSFVSFSESEQSFSDRSVSLLSMGNDSLVSGNDSIASLGNVEESVDSEGKINSATKLRTSGSFPDRLENLGSPVVAQKLDLGSKRLSLSERLQGVKSVNSGSDLNISGTSEVAPDLDEGGDDELESIMKAQKLEKQKSERSNLAKLESDSDIADAKINSSSDIGCQSLEITDEDDELREMLAAQKSFNSSQSSENLENVSGLRHKDTVDLSVENDDLEYQEIIASQKKNQSIEDACNDSELQRDFEINRPSVQSSPLVTISTKLQESDMSLSPSKRSDEQQQSLDGKSPIAKKLKRRNLSLYEGESVE